MRSKRYLATGCGGGVGAASRVPAVQRGRFLGPRLRSEVLLAVNLKSWLKARLSNLNCASGC